MKKPIALLLAATFLLALGGCETIKGLGKDIEKAGEAISKKADEASK